MKYKRFEIVVKVFMLFLLPAFNLRAQESKSLTLNEAIELSIKNSKQLQLSKAKVAEAVAVTKQATQERLPNASIGANFMQLSNATVHSYRKDTTATAPLNINQVIYGSANISYPIFTGFKVKFGIESAKYLEQATMLDADNDKEDVILNHDFCLRKSLQGQYSCQTGRGESCTIKTKGYRFHQS
jgi:outer membrane protein TolC